MEWKKDSGIEGVFGEDYILKTMPREKRRYGNSETMERNDG